MALDYYFYYIYYTFLGFPFIIRVAAAFICFYTPFFLFSTFKLINARQKFYRKRKLQKQLRGQYADQITDIITSPEKIYDEDIKNKINCNIKKLSNNKKRILTNLILSIQTKEKSINEGNYQRVVEYFELRQFWEGKLKYGSLAARQRALRKLDDLDIEIPGSVITSLTYNRNQYLRKRARSSYVYFSKNDPFKFFDEDFDKTFNDWDKIEIHKMLDRRSREGLPNLSQWIKNSKNSKFQCFLVDEIRYFNQRECLPHLLEMLNTHDITLLKHIIDALGEMKYKEAEKQIIKDYALQPRIIQQCVIKAVHKLNTGKSLSFLEAAYNNVHDRESEIIILRAIYNYGEQGRQLFNSMKTVSGGFSKLIFDHVSNPLIKYN